MPKTRIIDQDTTDDFLDKPPLIYEDGSTITWEEIEEDLAKAKRGEITLPELPPPVEH